MNTDQLITALANDLSTGADPSRASARQLFAAATISIVVAILVTALCLGVRPDLRAAIVTAPVIMKFLASIALAAGAFYWALGQARPDAPRWRWLAILPGVLLFAAPIWIERVEDVAREVAASAINGTGPACIALIIGVSAAPLLVLLQAMRAGAATRPALAGSSAGLVAGGIGCCAYALHCTGDTAAFGSVWYPLAVGLVAASGAIIGRRVLAW